MPPVGAARAGLLSGRDAISGSVVFTFESGDLSNWRNTDGGSIATSPVNQGTYACLTDDNDNNELYSEPGDGLNNYPSPDGGEFFWAQYNEDAGDHRFNWAGDGSDLPGSNIGYGVAHRPGNNRFELLVDGSAIDTDSTPPPTDEWLINTGTWDSNGDISVTVEDTGGNTIATLSANDSTYTSEGAVYIDGRSTGSGGKVYWDAPQF